MQKNRVLTISNTEEIIRRLKKDDKSAVDDLFSYYYPRLYHFSKSILRIENDIDDILQEVFVKIWLNRQNTKVFNDHYNVRIDGAFILLLRKTAEGDTIADESQYVDINGITEVEFKVQPFLKLEWIGEPTVSGGQITATVKVTRAVSPAAFKAKIEPLGGYNDDFLNVTDVRLFVSQMPYVGYREYDERYTTQINYSGNSFDVQPGVPVTITTTGVIPAGRTVFIRAAARINYATENVKRHNYNEAKRIDIP